MVYVRACVCVFVCVASADADASEDVSSRSVVIVAVVILVLSLALIFASSFVAVVVSLHFRKYRQQAQHVASSTFVDKYSK